MERITLEMSEKEYRMLDIVAKKLDVPIRAILLNGLYMSVERFGKEQTHD